MAGFDKFKGKISNFFFANDEEYDEDETVEEARPSYNREPMFEREEPAPQKLRNNYNYSPTAGLEPPEYGSFAQTKIETPAAAPEYVKAADTEKKGGTIYNMSSARSFTKFKIGLVVFDDLYDVVKAADLMIERDTIVIVNITNLPEDHRARAMDFLDGVKHVTKSFFTKLSDNIAVYVPENVELYGDFRSQVDIGSIRQF